MKRRRRRRFSGPCTELSRPTDPNVLWCADDKGEFMLGNRRYWYPLTITDFASRYLLTCEALSTTQERFALPCLSAPSKTSAAAGIRTDNGGDQARRGQRPAATGTFDTWIAQYNEERPHQALAMIVPADVYTRSPRVYRGLEDLTYPFHDQTIAVTDCGRISGVHFCGGSEVG
jgi:putative transposase